jgi:hypothetical protein
MNHIATTPAAAATTTTCRAKWRKSHISLSEILRQMLIDRWWWWMIYNKRIIMLKWASSSKRNMQWIMKYGRRRRYYVCISFRTNMMRCPVALRRVQSSIVPFGLSSERLVPSRSIRRGSIHRRKPDKSTFTAQLKNPIMESKSEIGV